MILDKVGNTTIVSQENISLARFLENLVNEYAIISSDNIIVNLFSFTDITPDSILEFLDVSRVHKNNNKSFVLVSDKIGYDELPDEINLVPTLQEAHDIIEMEEIERDLGI